MMQIVDISKPKLWQLQKIRNSNALTRSTEQDVDVVGTGKRLVQMTLTDGIQEVEAIEYKPINSIGLNLAPGTKIRIMGPVVLRRGRLMLEEKNVKVLGGEVEELSVSHVAENVLARFLKLPENSTPKAIEEKTLRVEREEKNEGYVCNFTENREKNRNLSENEEMAKEIDMLMEVEAELNEIGDFDLNQKNSLDDDNNDVFTTLDIDAHLDQIDSIFQTTCETIPISKLLENQNNDTMATFKIKAKFKSVIEKLTIVEDEYKLVIEVEDASGTLKVRLHNDVIVKFAECSPNELTSLKNNILSKEDAAVEKMMQVIMKIKNKLVELDDIMSVQLEKNRIPLVTKIS
ncbi:recQ-mediated genome instability protein 1-like isoform X2 [Tribolium madens]|nr:recQ-mediated genome instability protein 1-like isoform X2 [Tribolium madens]